MVFLSFTSIVGNFLAGAVARVLGLSPRQLRWLCAAYFLAMFWTYHQPRSPWDQFWWLSAIGVSPGVFALFTMYLPPLFPTLLRTTGAGFCYNIGRLAAAGGTVFFGQFAEVGDCRRVLLYAAFSFCRPPRQPFSCPSRPAKRPRAASPRPRGVKPPGRFRRLDKATSGATRMSMVEGCPLLLSARGSHGGGLEAEGRFSQGLTHKDARMKANRAFRLRAPLGMGLFLLAVFGGRGQTAVALTPESPKVREAVAKAVKFLESDAANDGRVGAKALVGLVLLKNHADAKHPRIVDAVAAIRGAIQGHEPAKIGLDIYSAGLSVIFLVTLDPAAYSPEIQCLLDFLKARQKSHGGWGYPERPTGDTSMTQYGVLCLWEAKQAGFGIPQNSVEAVTTWLLKTQDPGGGFGYQGEPSATKARKKQADVRHSMTAAGLGSLFICADLLGFVPREEKRDESLPLALKEVRVKRPAAAAAANPNGNIDPRRVKEGEILGNKWMARHYDMKRKEWWTYYYLYAYERYASFRELSEGKAEKEPKWYDDGAHYILFHQDADGSWTIEKSPIGGKAPDTAFAALFLLRSSKRSIEKAYGYNECTMAAGRGLPKETDKLTVFRGRVLPAARMDHRRRVARCAREARRRGRVREGRCGLGRVAPQRGGGLLNAFAASFVPALLSMTLIVSGQQTATHISYSMDAAFKDPLPMSLVFIWSGNVVVLLAAVYLTYRLQRR